MSRIAAVVLALGVYGISAAWAGDGEGLSSTPPRMGGRSKPLPTLVTEFEPARDGMPFDNRGSYRSVGDCMGMTLLSVTRFKQRMSRGGDEKVLPSGAGDAVVRDISVQAAASVVQLNSEVEYDSWEKKAPRKPLWDPKPGQDVYDRLRETSQPQILGIWNEDESKAHVVVVYGYKDGGFLVYDPNEPGATKTWLWDKNMGFAPTDLVPEATKVALVPADALGLTPRLPEIVRACEEADTACVASFAPMKTTLGVKDGKPVVEGQVEVAPGEAKPVVVLVYANDKVVGYGLVDDSGRFSVSYKEADPKSLRIATLGPNGQIVSYGKALRAYGPALANPASKTPGLLGGLDEATLERLPK